MRHLLRKAAALSVAALALSGVVSQPSADAKALLPPIVFPKHADESSLNWAGYVQKASGSQQITDVQGRWTVPATNLVIPSWSVTWVGIGGHGTSDLIQAGTLTSFFEGYYAWYEMLPDALIPITSGCAGDNACTVVPGDDIITTINYRGSSNWRFEIINNGKWSWSKDVTYASSFSSAEWIFEAPTVAGVQSLPQGVGVQRFNGSHNRFVVDGVNHPVTAGAPIRTHLGFGVANLATVSDLKPSGSFNVCTYAQSSAAPAS